MKIFRRSGAGVILAIGALLLLSLAAVAEEGSTRSLAPAAGNMPNAPGHSLASNGYLTGTTAGWPDRIFLCIAMRRSLARRTRDAARIRALSPCLDD